MEIDERYPRYQLNKAIEGFLRRKEAGGPAYRTVRKWLDVIAGMAAGSLSIGERKPTRFPVWVTLEVARGGFATGRAAAVTPLGEDEIALLRRIGSEAAASAGLKGRHTARRTIFDYLLSDDGLAGMREILEGHRFRIEVPEDAALLSFTWLLTHGEHEAALSILEAILPYSDLLRFLPKETGEARALSDFVWRYGANEAKARLAARRPDPGIAAQREALGVWLPFTDRVVSFWLKTRDDTGRVASVSRAGGFATGMPDGWEAEAAALLAEYERLRVQYTLCKKYHSPKENLGILLTALRDMLGGDPDHPGDAKARYAVGCFLSKYGEPGGERHRRLRAEQARVAGLPGYETIAAAVAGRLPASDSGIEDTAALLGPILHDEAKTGLPEGTPVPPCIGRVVEKSRAAALPTLIALGLVPSAEVLAELSPSVAAYRIGLAHRDPALGLLLSETYKAFARRRSLLLLDLQSQARIAELPWVSAVPRDQLRSGWEKDVVMSLAAAAIDRFPGVILPNVLIEQFNGLYGLAENRRPFVAELAADIFMGRLTETFDQAALCAGRLLRGTLYERYYGLDYDGFFLRKTREKEPLLMDFVRAHRQRDPMPAGSHVVENGTLIERIMIHTTHNLATLVEAGVAPGKPFAVLALDALSRVLHELRIAAKSPWPLAHVKNAAYAWRQALFFLALAPEEDCRERFLAAGETSAALKILDETGRGDLFAGLRRALDGASLDEPGAPRRFLGWTTGGVKFAA